MTHDFNLSTISLVKGSNLYHTIYTDYLVFIKYLYTSGDISSSDKHVIAVCLCKTAYVGGTCVNWKFTIWTESFP